MAESVYDPVPSTQTQRLRALLRASPLSAIEMFHPLVARRLCVLWGSRAFGDYLEQLVRGDDGIGVPFNQAEFDELDVLARLHRSATPVVRRERDPWGRV